MYQAPLIHKETKAHQKSVRVNIVSADKVSFVVGFRESDLGIGLYRSHNCVSRNRYRLDCLAHNRRRNFVAVPGVRWHEALRKKVAEVTNPQLEEIRVQGGTLFGVRAEV